MDTLAFIWALSSAVSWALVAINTPLGDMMPDSDFKRTVRIVSSRTVLEDKEK